AELVAQRRVALSVAGRPRGQAVHQRRSQGQERRQRRPHQPELQGDRRRAGLRDLVGRLPARRHQSQSVRRRLRPRLPDQLGAGLEDPVGGLAAVQRRSVLRAVGPSAESVPGRERHYYGGQRAELKGAEVQGQWRATDNLMLSAAAAYYNAELTEDFIELDSDNQPVVTAPDGTQLPVTPEFKANLIARY